MHTSDPQTSLFKTDSSRWAAVQTRNPLAASAFVYCVTSTKICCRPTCKARLARRSNVIFHDTYVDAAAAGFRACKRCRPELQEYDPQADVVARACRAIENAEAGTAGVKLEELAKGAGLTKSHFHRVFKKVTGVTPRIYTVNLRAEKLLGVVPVVSTPCLESGSSSTGGSDGILTPDAPCLQSGHGADGEFVVAEFQAFESLDASCEQVADGMGFGSVFPATENCEFTKHIEYTIQPWASGFVLIATTRDGICWLEAGSSVAELSMNLAHEFPLANLEVSNWSTNANVEEVQTGRDGMFATVMEALVRPTGKILDVPFDIS